MSIVAHKKSPKGNHILVAKIDNLDQESRQAVRCYVAKAEMMFCNLGTPVAKQIPKSATPDTIKNHSGSIDFTKDDYIIMHFDFFDVESAAFLLEMIVLGTYEYEIPESLEIDDPMTVFVTCGIWENRDSENKYKIVKLLQSICEYGIIKSDRELCKEIIQIIQ